ncbi:MAG: hypothetical protein IIZ59_02510 [Clostridia bacterium]|nr:hypothetical protein [Clostridia bacterium]
MDKFLRAVRNIIISAVILAVVVIGGGVMYLTSNEYAPEDNEEIGVYGTSSKHISPGDTVRVMTYCAGYGAKDNAHDNYEDGGKTVITENEDIISENIKGIAEMCIKENPDIILFQEVDIDSRRSFALDEASLLCAELPERLNCFAYDFVCDFVPEPITNPTGRVNSGMLTLTNTAAESAQRKSLASTEVFPQKAWSRKPCLLVQRTKVEESTKELVVINLNFEAYGDPDVRLGEFKSLCEFMQLEYAKGNYVIAGGCFNASLPSVPKGKYLYDDDYEGAYIPSEFTTELLTGGWKYCTDDSEPTMRLMNEVYDSSSSTARFYCVDGFITSPNTIAVTTRTVDSDFRYSSHNPVVTEITLVK